MAFILSVSLAKDCRWHARRDEEAETGGRGKEWTCAFKQTTGKRVDATSRGELQGFVRTLEESEESPNEKDEGYAEQTSRWGPTADTSLDPEKHGLVMAKWLAVALGSRTAVGG